MKTITPYTASTNRGGSRYISDTYRLTVSSMTKLILLGVAFFLSAGMLAGSAAAAQKKVTPTASAPVKGASPLSHLKNNLAPLSQGEQAVTTHAPFATGDCGMCHKSGDPKNPGPVGDVNQLCLGCHEDFQRVLASKFSHVAAQQSCVNCHNPHNSKQRKLLVDDADKLCFGCHEAIKSAVSQAVVQHDAVTQGAKCTNCHNPHGSNVQYLLVQLPMQLCLQCHGNGDLADHDGKKLTNMKKLLAENPRQHGPVAAQDCSACHNPHGDKNFRLLKVAYPATFYSPYDPKLYALCFGCHEEKAFTEPETTTLTQFRNGSKNLHYVHVHKSDFGRTCRACHEVHASVQDHQIRDAVPYGSKGWLLKINYTKNATGGSCEKTCHATKVYNNVGNAAPKE